MRRRWTSCRFLRYRVVVSGVSNGGAQAGPRKAGSAISWRGRHVQPVVLAEELAERRRRAHATDPVTDREAGREDGEDARSEGSHKHRKTGLQLGAAGDRTGEETAAPEPIVGTTTRGKRKSAHKPVVDAKRRREAAAAAFDDMDIDEDGPAPAGPAPFSAPEVEE